MKLKLKLMFKWRIPLNNFKFYVFYNMFCSSAQSLPRSLEFDPSKNLFVKEAGPFVSTMTLSSVVQLNTLMIALRTRIF